MVVGLLFVSLGTSAPELFVSISAALTGHGDISVGNVVGSNIANIALALGLTALIVPIVVKSPTILRDWLWMAFSVILLIILTYFLDNKLNYIVGIVFLSLLAFYIYISLRDGKINDDEIKEEFKHQPLIITISIFVASLIGMYYGSEFLINSATNISLKWGVSEKVISVTIVAFGTSIPEITTSLIAAIKKEASISIGTIIGSNIFNILSILGITSLVHTIPINPKMLHFDMMWMLAVSILMLLSILPLRKGKLGRLNGLLLVIVYLVYIFLQFK
jgi:cation:H+ antiporter